MEAPAPGTAARAGAQDRVAVVGLNMGGPRTPPEVEPFLEALFADRQLVRLPWFLRPFQGALARRVARKRGPEARINYAKIGGGSPILGITEAQMAGVAARLSGLGVDALGLVAMRYTAPRARDAARRARSAGVRRVVALSLYPQYSPSTGGSSLADFRTAWSAEGGDPAALVEIANWGSERFYLDTVAAMVRERLDLMGEPRPHVLFSAHGLPAAYVRRGDPYRGHVEATFRGVVDRLPDDVSCSLAFQSRVGPAEWIRPYTDERVRELARDGVRRLLMVPLAFVSDHVETLYEMDMLYGGLARDSGIPVFERVAAPNATPRFTAGLGDLVARALGVPVPAEAAR